MAVKEFTVKRITYEDTKDFILNLHYAQRMPQVTYPYGLFHGESLVGVLTIGKPASHSLCIGVCGKEYAHKVYELNRLITIDGLPRNVLSWFVGYVLRDLKEESLIIVSYADTGAGHNGYIYQATNFLYTGATKQRTDKYTPKNKHSRHYNDEHNHLRKVRTSKHRYVYFTNDKKKYRKLLNYPIEDYPKEENRNYVLGTRLRTKILNKETNQAYYE